MTTVWKILKEQFLHLNLIFRLSIYEMKSKYNMHYLGVFWHIVSPFMLIAIYWFIFGLGIRGGAPVGGTPFFLWLLTGMIPWLFITQAISQGANSVHSKIHLVSKMKFPVSVLPTIKIVGISFSFVLMLTSTIVILLIYGVYPGYYILQLPYYFICLYFLVFSLTLLLSTLTTIIRDIQNIVQSVMRIMLYMLPVVWNVDSLPPIFVDILRLNPFFYIIVGFRDSLLGGNWFFNDLVYTSYFWSISLLTLLIGSSVHMKFRHKFVDYI